MRIASGKLREYVHQELNQDIAAISGYYVLMKEVRLPFRGREVLYLVGYAAYDTTCCGVGGCAYALVPGFIVRWKGQTNKDSFAVSQVEPVRDELVQTNIRRLIKENETVHQVQFR